MGKEIEKVSDPKLDLKIGNIGFRVYVKMSIIRNDNLKLKETRFVFVLPIY